MIQLLFFGACEVFVPSQSPSIHRSVQVEKLKKAVRDAEREVCRIEDELDDASGELESAEEELENFLETGTLVGAEICDFAANLLFSERYLSGAARETIEAIIYDGERAAPLLLFAQNYGWEIPTSVREAVKQHDR